MSANTHIFKETYAFLENSLPDGFYCESFDNTLTQKLYTTLSYHFDEEDIVQNREQVRKAFKSYFSLLNQTVSLFFRGNDTIVVKDLKKHIFGEYSQEFHEKSQLLATLSGDFNEFLVKDSVYMIPKERLIDHGCDFENIEDETLRKELYRETAKVAFGLEKRDLVFFMNDKLTIKNFVDAQDADRRAYGLPPEELEKLKTMVFEQNILDEIKNEIAILLNSSLSFSLISNDFFRKNSIGLVQKSLYKIASVYLSEDSHIALKNAFVNYIFREHFYTIHKLFAQTLLELHAYRDRNVEEFLRFFDGNMEVIDGKQTRKPEIIDAKKNKWNAVSILPVVIQKIRCDREMETFKDAITKAQAKRDDLEQKMQACDIEMTALQEQKTNADNAMKEVLTQSKELQDRNYRLKRQRTKNNSDPAIQDEINELVIQIRQFSKQEEELRSATREANNSFEIAKTKMKNITTEVASSERYIKERYRKMDNLAATYAPIIEKYELIIGALAKTLAIKY
jgi:predicted  nucleic acid-binding Zn-ribbon protein